MLLKGKNLALALVAVAGLLFILAPVNTHALDCDNPANNKDAVQCGTNQVSGNTNTSDKGQTSINHTITSIINILSVLVGIVAVIMIIFGGFRYITSGGDSTKVGNAKNTILYALIGLIVVALAQIIVSFVINKSIGPECVGGKWDSGPKINQACS